MGATNFLNEWRGANFQDGFAELKQQAEWEYGDNPYNGTLSTTRLSGREPRRIADRYSETARKRALKFLDQRSWGDKWVCEVLDLGVVEYEVATYKKVPQKAEARWETRYAVCENGRRVKTLKTVVEARAFLERRIAVADGSVDSYTVEKVPENVSGGSCVATLYERQVRRYKTKPKRIPSGAVCVPIHVWWFYGWAGC